MDDVVNYFMSHTTEEIAQFLLGMYLEYENPEGSVAGFIVDAEAYLGSDDEGAHSYGLRKTPRLKAMYEQPGTIYLYTMHTHLILNIVTQEQGKPQGVMIRGIEPITGIELMKKNRKNIQGTNLTNGPGKLVAALDLSKDLYGLSIFTSELHLVPEKRRYPKKIIALPRIGIPNKGIWTDMPLRYVVKGNPYISKQKLNEIDRDSFGWKEVE